MKTYYELVLELNHIKISLEAAMLATGVSCHEYVTKRFMMNQIKKQIQINLN